MSIPDRAILECFYGPLWSSQARHVAVRRAASHAATAYVYGPAADLRTGQNWREPYRDKASALQELVQAAHDSGMTATWRVSPGAPLARAHAMAMGDPSEQAVLLDRITEVIELGFDRVLIAFDDLTPEVDPATRSVFGHDAHPIAAAQAHVLNTAHRRVAELGAELLVCPTHYWGVEPSRYRFRLGELLDPELAVCWTGPTVTSSTIEAEQVRQVSEHYGRPLWIWDNFPVNDWDGVESSFSNDTTPRRLPLAPLRGRAADLDGAVAGYGANAALAPHTGLPAVCTALDWARDPAGYDPERSFRNALSEAGDPAALELLADVCGALPVGGQPGRLARAACSAVSDPGPANLRMLANHIDDTAHAVAPLHEVMDGELGPWLDALAVVLPASRSAVRILTEHVAGSVPADADIVALREALATWPRVSLADGALFMLVDRAIGIAGAGCPPWPDPE